MIDAEPATRAREQQAQQHQEICGAELDSVVQHDQAPMRGEGIIVAVLAQDRVELQLVVTRALLQVPQDQRARQTELPAGELLHARALHHHPS